jgi:hypothetical protein
MNFAIYPILQDPQPIIALKLHCVPNIALKLHFVPNIPSFSALADERSELRAILFKFLSATLNKRIYQ